VAGRVVIRLDNLDRFRNEAVGLFTRGGGAGDLIVRRWGLRLRSYWQERFAKLSRGGGEWDRLRPATEREKERLGSRTPVSILRRFGPMFHSLDAVYSSLPGQLQTRIPDGVEYGIGGPGAYPEGPTIGTVARYHHDGMGNLPTRRVIDLPPQSLIKQMATDVLDALSKYTDA